MQGPSILYCITVRASEEKIIELNLFMSLGVIEGKVDNESFVSSDAAEKLNEVDKVNELTFTDVFIFWVKVWDKFETVKNS